MMTASTVTAFPGVPGTLHDRYDDHGIAHARMRAGDIIMAELQAPPYAGHIAATHPERGFSARGTEGA